MSWYITNMDEGVIAGPFTTMRETKHYVSASETGEFHRMCGGYECGVEFLATREVQEQNGYDFTAFDAKGWTIANPCKGY